MRGVIGALLVLGAALTRPIAAQTVIYPDPPPRADSARPREPATGTAPAPRDTARGTAAGRDTSRAVPASPGAAPAAPAPAAAARPPAPPAAAPSIPIDPVLARVCADVAAGESAPDLLAIVFERAADPAARDAALATVSGKRLGGTAEDRFQYVQVPAGGSEFRLRALADKLIRLQGISEVGPVLCPEPADSTRAPS